MMEQQATDRQGMPRSVVVAPILMLVAGIAASVGLWVLLTRDAPRLSLSANVSVGGWRDADHGRP